MDFWQWLHTSSVSCIYKCFVFHRYKQSNQTAKFRKPIVSYQMTSEEGTTLLPKCSGLVSVLATVEDNVIPDTGTTQWRHVYLYLQTLIRELKPLFHPIVRCANFMDSPFRSRDTLWLALHSQSTDAYCLPSHHASFYLFQWKLKMETSTSDKTIPPPHSQYLLTCHEYTFNNSSVKCISIVQHNL